MELAGKVVIVTGASGNIGSACTREAAAQGAKVVASDLPGSRVQALVAEIRDAGGEALAHEGDISVEADVMAMVALAKQTYGAVDGILNVAAAMNLVMSDRDIETMEIDHWDRMMAVNLRGAMLCCKHIVPIMRAQGSGSIIHFGSTSGILGDIGLFAYSTTKAGLTGFTRAIATSYGKDGIRCNTVCPGSVQDEAGRARLPPALQELFERTRMTARMGVPEDVAYMSVFLLSDKASYLTGQSFVVDGGGTTHQPWVRVK